MAYTAANLTLTSESPLTGAGQMWRHISADTATVARVTGFITNGGAYGMKVNDLLFHTDSGTGAISTHRVVTVNASTGAVDLGDATVVGSATNTD